MLQYRKEKSCISCGHTFIAESYNSVVCSPECRFVAYENRRGPDDCWNWTGPTTAGYGRLFLNLSRDGKRISIAAHHYALKRIGIAVPKGKLVMHRCDNPACVNPKHLQIGTWGENNKDRSEKGRSGARIFTEEDRKKYSARYRGDRNNAAKLDDEAVREIRKDPRGCQTIANEYGVSKKAILNIRHRRSWAHVED